METEMTGPLEMLEGSDLHQRVIVDEVLHAQETVWIATANLKDMHIAMARGYRPILQVFDDMARRGVRFRVIHSEIPSKPFRDTLDKCANLLAGAMELQICPRSHWKLVIVDSRFAYMGSANFTGAGLGVKKPSRRNLEIGAVTREPSEVNRLVGLFDSFWMGESCADCAFTRNCPDPIA